MPRKFKNNRDRQLQTKYGISQDEYDNMLRKQGGVCKICGKPPTGRSLHVEHWHALRYFKLVTTKVKDGWLSKTDVARNPVPLVVFSVQKTKSAAIRAVRECLKRKSIRFIACWQCNSMLRWGHDSPDILRSAANCLESYIASLIATSHAEIGEIDATRA